MAQFYPLDKKSSFGAKRDFCTIHPQTGMEPQIQSGRRKEEGRKEKAPRPEAPASGNKLSLLNFAGQRVATKVTNDLSHDSSSARRRRGISW